MPSTIELEETLPLMAPVSKAQFSRLENDMKFTVYSTVPLDDSPRQQLLADLHDYEDIIFALEIRTPLSIQITSLLSITQTGIFMGY